MNLRCHDELGVSRYCIGAGSDQGESNSGQIETMIEAERELGQAGTSILNKSEGVVGAGDCSLSVTDHRIDPRRKTKGSSNKEIFGFGIVYATSHNSYAGDGDNLTNGLFTRFFKQEVLTPGLSIYDVFDRVRGKVVDASNGSQRPSFHDERSGRYSFLPSN